MLQIHCTRFFLNEPNKTQTRIPTLAAFSAAMGCTHKVVLDFSCVKGRLRVALVQVLYAPPLNLARNPIKMFWKPIGLQCISARTEFTMCTQHYCWVQEPYFGQGEPKLFLAAEYFGGWELFTWTFCGFDADCFSKLSPGKEVPLKPLQWQVQIVGSQTSQMTRKAFYATPKDCLDKNGETF